jgi:hypothetical protein
MRLDNARLITEFVGVPFTYDHLNRWFLRLIMRSGHCCVLSDGLPLSAALLVADDVPLAVICLEHPGKRSRSSKIPPVFDE